MADALVSVVLEQLRSIIIQEVGQEVRLVVGVKNEVEKLTSSFRAIQAVLANAEERQLEEGYVKLWLDQLKDISYDMDDVLDEWGTAIAKSQSKVHEHPHKNKKKVCSFMIFSYFRFREVDIDGAAESKIDSFSRDARHSMVVFRNYDTNPLPATIHSFKKLRSLIVDGRRSSSMNAALPNLIANLSCLRTLRLSRCGIEEVPSNIEKLIHLRHVDFSWNKIKELPEEMCELYNMLTLDVSGCEKLERLPDNIGRLVKLRHLSVNNFQFMKMRGVEGLSSLRELDEFHVSGSGEESNIGDLRNLNHLQGYLRIRWLGDVKDPDEVKKAELHNKKHLTHLELRFDSRTNRRIICDDSRTNRRRRK
uniref:Uncharacterized protein n=1 Tax=Populus alba TaxID=43335 RepID=A0A4U5MHV9_POPAL|nr:hypothetical protein D5086_0000309090 [Populus alba]